MNDPDIPNAPPNREALIAYRYYSEEEGHKVDEERNGKKYVGWSSKYDEWIPVTSPRIQKLKSISKFYKVAGKTPMQYDHIVYDESDTIFNTDSFV